MLANNPSDHFVVILGPNRLGNIPATDYTALLNQHGNSHQVIDAGMEQDASGLPTLTEVDVHAALAAAIKEAPADKRLSFILHTDARLNLQTHEHRPFLAIAPDNQLESAEDGLHHRDDEPDIHHLVELEVSEAEATRRRKNDLLPHQIVNTITETAPGRPVDMLLIMPYAGAALPLAKDLPVGSRIVAMQKLTFEGMDAPVKQLIANLKKADPEVGGLRVADMPEHILRHAPTGLDMLPQLSRRSEDLMPVRPIQFKPDGKAVQEPDVHPVRYSDVEDMIYRRHMGRQGADPNSPRRVGFTPAETQQVHARLDRYASTIRDSKGDIVDQAPEYGRKMLGLAMKIVSDPKIVSDGEQDQPGQETSTTLKRELAAVTVSLGVNLSTAEQQEVRRGTISTALVQRAEAEIQAREERRLVAEKNHQPGQPPVPASTVDKDKERLAQTLLDVTNGQRWLLAQDQARFNSIYTGMPALVVAAGTAPERHSTLLIDMPQTLQRRLRPPQLQPTHDIEAKPEGERLSSRAETPSLVASGVMPSKTTALPIAVNVGLGKSRDEEPVKV